MNQVAHKLAPAVAVGAPIVLKPSEKTPLAALWLARVVLDAGYPPDAVAVVTGDPRLILGEMLAHEAVEVIAFTGGVPVGEEIANRAGFRRTILELGGNDPLLVPHDADLEEAAGLAVSGATRNSGQRCTAVKRILVEQQVADRLVDLIEAGARSLVVGEPLSEDTDIGTLIDEDAAVRVEQRVVAAVVAGARLLHGGERSGAQITPPVLDNVPPAAELVHEETFGPAIPVVRVEDLDEAIAVANSTRYGLSAGVVTNDLNAITRCHHPRGAARAQKRQLREEGVTVPCGAREGCLPPGTLSVMPRKLSPLLCELHAHTTWSDGSLSTRELCDLYGRRGFDVLAVTDHTTRIGTEVTADLFDAYLAEIEAEAERARSLYDLLVLPGLELTYDDPDPTESAHVVAIGLRRHIDLAEESLESALAVARAQGAALVAAHPYSLDALAGATRGTAAFAARTDELAPLVDRFELFNRHTLFDWVAAAGLPALATGDFHDPEPPPDLEDAPALPEGRGHGARLSAVAASRVPRLARRARPRPRRVAQSSPGELRNATRLAYSPSQLLDAT